MFIPEELFIKMCNTIGTQMYLSGVPESKLEILIPEVLEDWELYNCGSELYIQAVHEIRNGFNNVSKYMIELAASKN